MASSQRPTHCPGALVQVNALEDIAFLIKESEVLTGSSGRGFSIVGADRLMYWVHLMPWGFQVDRLECIDSHVCIRHRAQVPFWQLRTHVLGTAVTCGQLYVAENDFTRLSRS